MQTYYGPSPVSAQAKDGMAAGFAALTAATPVHALVNTNTSFEWLKDGAELTVAFRVKRTVTG